jgi:hypothetical protein
MPKRLMVSNGELPRMLKLSMVSVGGEPQLEIEQLDAEDA